MAQLFLKYAADTNALTYGDGRMTALQIVASSGDCLMAMELLKFGADPNGGRAKVEGRTALEAAAEHGHLDMVKLLLDSGADISGTYAETARDFAKKNGHSVVADYLDQHCV